MTSGEMINLHAEFSTSARQSKACRIEESDASLYHTATAPTSMLRSTPNAATCPLLLENLVDPGEAAPFAARAQQE